jgi:hypothetical protein
LFLGKVDMKEAIRKSQSCVAHGLRDVHICG